MNLYNLAATVSFDEKDQDGAPHILIPPNITSPRICTFCSKSEQNVTFKKISHIIPESLGNKHILYNLECDTCNERFGHTLDQDLNNDVSVFRSLANRIGRTTTPKHQIRGKSHIKSGGGNSPVTVVQIDGEAPIIKNHDRLTRQFEVESDSYPVNYVNLARNLARMALMMMHSRIALNEYDHVIDWINSKQAFLPIFFRGFVPGAGLRLTTLAVYEPKPEYILGPKMLVQFMYCNFAYFLHIPHDFTKGITQYFVPSYPQAKRYSGSPHIYAIKTNVDGKMRLAPIKATMRYNIFRE